jgi:NAD(P)-dependent dehydrogenase (short-subunit alcohol dehydrogenase family)
MELQGKVALVAGATRGAGRGIARALGEKGATVVCTGRSTETRPGQGMGRPETVEQTARLVDRAGGKGIAIPTDHRDPEQVRALVRRIEEEQGRLDVLVNDVWGGDPYIEWGKPFWELDVEQGLKVVETAVHTHLRTARHAVPLMLRSGGRLVVEVTDGDGWWYRGNLVYDLVKTSVMRLAWDFAEELRPHGIAAVAVTPGFLRSEAMLQHFGVTEASWREGAKVDPNFIASETPLFVGRAVAALACDPAVMARSGRVLSSWELGRAFGLADEDGSRPDWGRHFEARYGRPFRPADDGFYAYLQGYEALRRMMEEAHPSPA